MFTERSKLTEKRTNPFYGSYKDSNILEEIHWQNRKKKHQLCIVSSVIMVLTVLAIGITLAITLPPLLERQANKTLDPLDPLEFPGPSPSVLRQFQNAALSSENADCSRIGNEILRDKNGTAVDTAISVALCIGVTSPQSSGLGGGLFMTVYTGKQVYTINARETAPDAVNPEFYKENPQAASLGAMSVGIPGELAGLWEAHQRFGRLTWAELVDPALQLAINGFKVSKALAKSLQKNKNIIQSDPVLSSEFLNPATDNVWKEGNNITRPRLAATLELLKSGGRKAFYTGSLATNIVNEITNAGGIITLDDLSTYSADLVTPISYSYRSNLTLFSLPMPSSGPVIAMALGILDGFGKKKESDFTAKDRGMDAHYLIEALKFASAHRSGIADPDFDNLTEYQNKLLSNEYANELKAKIADYQTFPDPTYYGAEYSAVEDSGTAHISVIGPEGDAVSLTTTINTGFGAGFMGNLTGIIYNNELKDFSYPNRSNAYGLSPNPGNYIEPGKRPASSMAPIIFVNSQGEVVLVSGGAGGAAIIPAVITTTWKALYRELNLKEAIDYPRFSPTLNPDEVFYEYGIPAAIIQDLERKGHRTSRVANTSYIGNVNAVGKTKTDGIILANADFRKYGDSAGF